MEFIGEMVFLGWEQRESKKSGNTYYLVKVMDVKTSEIYEFYVSGENQTLKNQLGNLTQLTPVGVKFKMSSFQSKAQVDMVQIGVKK